MRSSFSIRRSRNSVVLARSCSSVSFCISGSNVLMEATTGVRRLIARSFAVPKTLVRALSKNTEISVDQGNYGRKKADARVACDGAAENQFRTATFLGIRTESLPDSVRGRRALKQRREGSIAPGASCG